MRETEFDLSVCIVSWNSLDVLRECLDSVHRHTGDFRVEIIVVDNASGDGTQKALREEYPGVLLVENGSNLGFGRANNQAIAMSTGRYVALLNPDIHLRGEIADILRPLEADPLAGCVGCRLVEPDGGIQESCHEGFPTPWSEFLEGMLMDRLWERISGKKPAHETCAGVQEVAWVVGACMVFRREVLLDLGGFDERYYIYGEDVDLCYRLRQRGYKVLFVGTVEMLHHHGASSRKAGQKHFSSVMQRESMYRFMNRHYGALNGFLYRATWMFCSVFRIILLGSLYGLSAVFRKEKKESYLFPLGKYLRIFNWGLGLERWAKVRIAD
jgi:GT2 family glycosyltransferase